MMVRPILWVSSSVSLIAVGMSYLFLYKDALDGYHDILPVYFFVVAIVVWASVWGYLAAKLMGGKT